MSKLCTPILGRKKNVRTSVQAVQNNRNGEPRHGEGVVFL